jgi:hypothetical protein
MTATALNRAHLLTSPPRIVLVIRLYGVEAAGTMVAQGPAPYKMLVCGTPAVKVTIPSGQVGWPNGSIGTSPRIAAEQPTCPGNGDT